MFLALLLTVGLLAGCKGQTGTDPAEGPAGGAAETTEAAKTDGSGETGSGEAGSGEENGLAGERMLFYCPVSLGDMGIIDQLWSASTDYAKQYGLELDVVENGTDMATVVTSFVDAVETGDYRVVVAPEFAIMDTIMERANEDWSDIIFVIADISPLTDISGYSNIIGYGYKQNECSFLAAVYQCMTTKTNKVAIMIGNDTPVMNDFAMGWFYGVKWYNDNYGTNIDYVYAYRGAQTSDATYETCNVLYDAGADSLYNVSSASGLSAAKSCEEHGGVEGGYSMVGVDLDQWQIYKDSGTDVYGYENIVTSAVKNGYRALGYVMEQLMDGTVEFKNYQLGLLEDGVALCKNERYLEVTPQEVQAEIDAVEQKLRDGEITVPRYYDLAGGYDEYVAYRDDPAARMTK